MGADRGTIVRPDQCGIHLPAFRIEQLLTHVGEVSTSTVVVSVRTRMEARRRRFFGSLGSHLPQSSMRGIAGGCARGAEETDFMGGGLGE